MCELYNLGRTTQTIVSIPYSTGLLLLTVNMALGQASAPAPSIPPPVEVTSSDAALEGAIRARFAKSKIDSDEFTVHVSNGIATLDGRTDVIQHKGTATRLAKSSGAKGVQNRIEITEHGRQKASRRRRKAPRRVYVQRGEDRGGEH